MGTPDPSKAKFPNLPLPAGNKLGSNLADNDDPRIRFSGGGSKSYCPILDKFAWRLFSAYSAWIPVVRKKPSIIRISPIKTPAIHRMFFLDLQEWFMSSKLEVYERPRYSAICQYEKKQSPIKDVSQTRWMNCKLLLLPKPAERVVTNHPKPKNDTAKNGLGWNSAWPVT